MICHSQGPKCNRFGSFPSPKCHASRCFSVNKLERSKVTVSKLFELIPTSGMGPFLDQTQAPTQWGLTATHIVETRQKYEVLFGVAAGAKPRRATTTTCRVPSMGEIDDRNVPGRRCMSRGARQGSTV